MRRARFAARWFPGALAVCAMVVVACESRAPVAPDERAALATASNGALDRIAFESNREDGIDFDIWVVNEDGSDLVRLTTHAADDREPAFSRDGRRIAFASDRDGDWDIYVMNDDGTGLTQLTDDSAEDRAPAFSPDGATIVFDSDRDGDQDLYVMDAGTGAGVTQLTGIGPDADDDRTAEFSPNGGRIVFARGDFGGIWVLDLASATETRIVDPADVPESRFPTFSLGGASVAFAGLTDFADPLDIFLVPADGSGSPVNLTNSAVQDISPSFDPDQDRIAFSTNRFDPMGIESEIALMDGDGTGVTRVTGDEDEVGTINDYPSFGPPADPATIDDCMDGGWESFGFRNQGQCIRFVQTGQDSR